MALMHKGSRPITVDGIVYRWRVRNRPTYEQGRTHTPFLLAVEQATGVGSKLVVELPQAHPNNWLCGEAIAVLPSHVAQYIDQALAAGWQPEHPGYPFVLVVAPTLAETSGSRE